MVTQEVRPCWMHGTGSSLLGLVWARLGRIGVAELWYEGEKWSVQGLLKGLLWPEIVVAVKGLCCVRMVA